MAESVLRPSVVILSGTSKQIFYQNTCRVKRVNQFFEEEKKHILGHSKAQLHHKATDDEGEEDSKAGDSDRPGTTGALVQALVAGAAFRGARLWVLLYRSDASTSADHIRRGDALCFTLLCVAFLDADS